MKILAGTSKGLIVFEKTNATWKIDKIHFIGQPVSMLFIDILTQRWWVGLDHKHWGPKIQYSENNGQTWFQAAIPNYDNRFINKTHVANLRKIWIMANADPKKPGSYWLGTEPGGLFYSDDYGVSFSLNEPLWNHPSRNDDQMWFGAGRDHPFIHSIVVDPNDASHLYIAVSSAGIFESLNGGKSWKPKNNGLIATYLPNPNVEIGHDPHQLISCKSDPSVMWQQNHCGIFRTEDGGAQWHLISKENQIPHYGFALAVDDNNIEEAWVIPANSDEERVAANLKLSVYYTSDAGKTWKEQNQNIAGYPAFDIVLRHGFTKKEDALVFGTNNGNLYLSENRGENWNCLTNNLAPVFNVAIV